MKIEAPALVSHAGAHRLEAMVDGRRLWFEAPEGSFREARVEPFVVAALLGAMERGQALEVAAETAVSPRLLEGLARAQDLLHAWNPRLATVAVRARPGAPPAPGYGVALFFSGGVDATYSLFQNEAEVTHLVFVHGLEITLANASLFASALARNQESADRYGKVLLPVKTNLRELATAHNLSNFLYQGALLAAVALALGFPRTYVAASLFYRDLCPWGTHPLLDPLWSTEATEIVHHGAEATRAEKIARIGARPGALESLRVCLANREQYNCGACEKCLRTMVALRLLGLRSPAFPPLRSLRPVRRLRVEGADELPLFLENHALAVEKGDVAVARALATCIRRFRVRQILRLCDQAFLGGRLLAAWRRYRWGAEGPEPILPSRPS
jgi:hypothetical protein